MKSKDERTRLSTLKRRAGLERKGLPFTSARFDISSLSPPSEGWGQSSVGARKINGRFYFSLLAQETTNYHLSDVTGVKNVEIFLACGCRKKIPNFWYSLILSSQIVFL